MAKQTKVSSSGKKPMRANVGKLRANAKEISARNLKRVKGGLVGNQTYAGSVTQKGREN